jgi:hypothetical protein
MWLFKTWHRWEAPGRFFKTWHRGVLNFWSPFFASFLAESLPCQAVSHYLVWQYQP